MIVFCPSCGSRISVEPAAPGGDVTCPRCRSQFSTGGLKPADNVRPTRRFKSKKAGGGKIAGALFVLVVLLVVGGGAAGLYYGGVFARHAGGTSKSGAAPPSWQEFTSADGRFTVELPGTPEREHVKAPGRSAKVLATTYSVETSAATYTVAIQDFDGKQTPEQLIDQSRADLSAGKSGKLLGEKDVTAGDTKGKEFVAEVPNRGKAYIRFFIAGRRVYKLMAVGTGGKSPDEGDVAKFMDSFRVTS
jgi:hypothetical protein